jgi:hypothetical protein
MDGVEPVPCPHPGAIVVAGLGEDPDEGGLLGMPLDVSANAPAELMAELAGLRVWLGVGRCVECHALVAMVRLTDPEARELRGPEDYAGIRGGVTPWVAVALWDPPPPSTRSSL